MTGRHLKTTDMYIYRIFYKDFIIGKSEHFVEKINIYNKIRKQKYN